MRKIILSETQLKSLVKLLKEQNEDDEYYRITPEQYVDLITSASYNPKATMIKKFKGKPLYITGNLNLSGMKDLSKLGNVAYIDGNLNISHTNIASLGNTEVKGSVSDYGSEMERIRIRKEELAKLADAESRREDNEWGLDNPNIDEEGLAANALFQQLVSDGKLDEMDEDKRNELNAKIQRLKELQERYEDSEGILEPEEISPLFDEISDLESEIEELQDNYADVYYIIPQRYRSYGTLYNFEVIGLRNQEYMVGDETDMYDAAIENQEQLLDDVGLEGLSDWLINDNIDRDQVRNEMRRFYEDDIRESPESYFDSDDFELTTEQEERKEQLENYINEMEDLKTEKEEELESIENEDEKANLEHEIEEIENNIEKAQEELDSIEPDTEPTDEMIEEKVDYYVRRREPIQWLKEMDYDIRYYVDIKGVARDIVDSDGVGVLASYDGSYDEQTVKTADGQSYSFIIVRTN